MVLNGEFAEDLLFFSFLSGERLRGKEGEGRVQRLEVRVARSLKCLNMPSEWKLLAYFFFKKS